MKKILTLFITSLFIIVIYSGCSVKEEQTTVSEDKTTNSMSGESTISVPASDNDLYNENCLTGIMVGRSSTHKCIWVTLEEDIEGIEKGQDVIIELTDKLEKQVMDYIEILLPVEENFTPQQKRGIERLREDMRMRYFDAPDLKDVGNNGYRFINAVSDFATHSTPRRKTANYRENIFARTADGNPLIDRAYQMVLVA